MNTKTEMDTQAAAAWTNCGRRGDEYYRVITAWLVSRRGKGSESKNRELAHEYDNALNSFLALTAGAHPAAAHSQNVGLAWQYKAILAGDLNYFRGRRPANLCSADPHDLGREVSNPPGH